MKQAWNEADIKHNKTPMIYLVVDRISLSFSDMLRGSFMRFSLTAIFISNTVDITEGTIAATITATFIYLLTFDCIVSKRKLVKIFKTRESTALEIYATVAHFPMLLISIEVVYWKGLQTA